MSFDQRGFYQDVGERLRHRRRDRRLTQHRVATAIGIPRPTYASIEGGRQRVTVDVLWRAAVVLDCLLTDLVPEPVQAAPTPKGRDAALETTGPRLFDRDDLLNTSDLVVAG